MMNLFEYLKEELPDFREAMCHLLENKKSSSIIFYDGTKVTPMMSLRKEFFNPENEDNKKTPSIFEEIAEKKATHMYLLVVKGKHSYEYCSQEEKNKMLGCMATNNVVKSGFCSLTNHISNFNRVNIAAVYGITDSA